MSTNFGRDTSCTTELRTGRFASGARLVGEAVFRRLTTPRGMLFGSEEEQDYGLDLTDVIGSVNTRSDRTALEGRIRSELSKEERLETVTVAVVDTTEGVAKSFLVDVRCTTADGPFELQIGVGEVTATLVGLEAS